MRLDRPGQDPTHACSRFQALGNGDYSNEEVFESLGCLETPQPKPLRPTVQILCPDPLEVEIESDDEEFVYTPTTPEQISDMARIAFASFPPPPPGPSPFSFPQTPTNFAPSYRSASSTPSSVSSLSPNESPVTPGYPSHTFANQWQPSGYTGGFMPTPSVRFHPSFNAGFVFLLVENSLFPLPSLTLERNSDYFKATLASRGPSSESNPVILDDVKLSDFEFFLGALCPLQFDPITTFEAWSSVLALATKWSFKSVRFTAIRHLTTIASPIDKLVLGRQYDVLEWLQDAYVNICQRPEALSIEEAEKLGLKEAILISQVRQEVRVWAKLRDPKQIATTVRRGLLNLSESDGGKGGFTAIFPDELSDGVPLVASAGSEASGAYAPYADAFLGHSAGRDVPVKSEPLPEPSISSISQQRSTRPAKPRAASAAHTLPTVKEEANNGNAPGPTADSDNPFASMGSGLSGYAPPGKARSSRRKVSHP